MGNSTQQSEVTAGTPSPERLGSACACDVDDSDLGPDGEEDLTCPHCSGTGGEPLDDGITPCEYCDGEGYLYWM